MNAKVMLDIDGVIANFYMEFARFLNQEYGCTLDLYQEPESYSFNDWGHGVELVNMGEASNAWIRQGGISNIPPFTGLKDFSGKLHDKYDVSIVTARIGDWERKLPEDVNAIITHDTYDWLENQGIPTDNLHFTHKKIDFCQENNINTMIEDKLSTAIQASKNGINAILMDRPFNRTSTDLFRVYRANSFREALITLEELHK